MQTIVLSGATAKNKKLKAQFIDSKGSVEKTISFGDNRYEDFTTHHDPKRQKNYLARHKHDPTTIKSAGALSRDILWSKPSLKDAIDFTERKHGVKIIFKTGKQ
jgi:hypothetical protein